MEDPDGTLTENPPPESPNKNIKVETVGATHDGDDTDEMEVQEKDDHSENAEDQEMTQTEDSCVTTLQSSPKSITSTGPTDKPDGVTKNPESPAGDKVSQPEMAPPEEPPPEEDHSSKESDSILTVSQPEMAPPEEPPPEEDHSSKESDSSLTVSQPENEMAPPEEPPPDEDHSSKESDLGEASSLGTSENEVDGDHDEPPDANKGPEKGTEMESTQSKVSQPEMAPPEEPPPEEDHSSKESDSILTVSQPEMAPPEEPPPDEDHSSKESDLGEASSLGTSENEVDGEHDEPPDANKGPEKGTEMESKQSKGSTDKPDGVVKDQESPAGDQGSTDKPDGVIKKTETHAGDQVSQPEMTPPEEPPPEEDHSSKKSDLSSSLGTSENEVDGEHDEAPDANKGPEKDTEMESKQSKGSTDKPDGVVKDQESPAGDQGSTDKPDGVIKKTETHAGDQVSQPEMTPPEEPPPEEDHSSKKSDLSSSLGTSENEVDGEHDEAPDANKGPEKDTEMESKQSKGSTDKPDGVVKDQESPAGDQGSTDKPDAVIKKTETHAGDQVSQPEMTPPEEPPPEEDHSSKKSDLSSSLGTSENEVDGDHDEPPDANKGPEKGTEMESTQSKGSTEPDGVVKDQESPAGDQGNKRLWDYGIMGAGVVLVAVLAVCLHAFSSQSPPEQKEVRPVDVFLQELKLIQSRFPTQRAELWRRGRIHLERHLLMKHPTEPVSLILTAGRKAEKTLHCLARGLASAFSSAHNASVLHIDGANKAHLDSDQVKLDIDNQLRRAFEGDKPVAVIHRFEELPPGSTLIFYRYCDHENAAYKKTSLIFTVLLADEEELPTRLSLSAVEEMVDDHLKKKFLSAGQPVTFDLMDLDKYSGLWSRISHLILPVAPEEIMELEGCQET